MLDNLEIRKCLYLALSVTLTMGGLVGGAALGLDVPVLRQVTGFIFLTFVPGILILRILKIHNIGTVESLAYTVGLSLAFVMFAGLVVNSLFPLFQVANPISIYPLLITLSSFILGLGIIAYKRDRNNVRQIWPNLSFLFSPPNLFLILIALVAILGALSVSKYGDNTWLLLFIVGVAAIAALVAFDKFIPERAYPLGILLIALALLYHTETTLASPYLTGYDIRWELRYQNLVAQSGYWNPAIGGSVNTSLSIVLLAPIYSTILGMNAIWVFKIVYPLFFSLVPLALFQVYRQQIGDKGAFLSVFFFMSVLYFFGVSNRQQIAELFFALLILLMADRKMSRTQKSVLAIIFAVSLPVSHYGLAYVNFAYFIAGWLLLTLLGSDTVISWWGKLTARFKNLPVGFHLESSSRERIPPSILTGTLVTLYIVFSLTWYMYISSGTPFHALATIGRHIYDNLSEFSNPVARESLVATAAGLDFPSVSTLGRIFRVFQLSTQFFIVLGFIRLFFRLKGYVMRAEHLVMTMVSALILFASIAVPYFSGTLEVQRYYHITLFFLAPLCILGGKFFGEMLSYLFHYGAQRLRPNKKLPGSATLAKTELIYLRLVTVAVLIPYFLFNTGFIFEISKSERYNVVDIPSAEALSRYRMDMKGMNEREAFAIEWLADRIEDGAWILADQYGKLHRSAGFPGRLSAFRPETTPVSDVSDNEEGAGSFYVYLRTWNIVKNEAVFMFSEGERIKFGHLSFDDQPRLSRLIKSRNLVYSNGGAQILSP